MALDRPVVRMPLPSGHLSLYCLRPFQQYGVTGILDALLSTFSLSGSDFSDCMAGFVAGFAVTMSFELSGLTRARPRTGLMGVCRLRFAATAFLPLFAFSCARRRFLYRLSAALHFELRFLAFFARHRPIALPLLDLQYLLISLLQALLRLDFFRFFASALPMAIIEIQMHVRPMYLINELMLCIKFSP